MTAHNRRTTGHPLPQDAHRYVGARVREFRIMRGLTQHQLAALLGVTYQQEHKYETGINRIAAGRLYQLEHIPIA